MRNSILIVLLFFSVACQGSTSGQSGTEAPSHQLFDELLKKHVSKDGIVNYKGFIQEKPKLEKYLKLISENAPDRKTWSKDEQLAYWINAYNAFTVKLIVDNYPVKSIQDLHPTLKIPLINTVWHIKFFQIGGKDSNLDEIEHKILRKEFEEPRIHFAINCASFSCPPLLNEAFVASKIDQQLDKVAKDFINDPKRNKITADKLEISQIFSWFKGDFTKKSSLIDFLNRYASVKINSNAKISHMKYDWTLNE
ncbi:hypothetical protein P872_14960 [Rhodonellum psychrophilum GCM71 = DSM 17998]|uniref:DUF547 domain-containing protein n=2 Tax=Rhodonellum TaxID=336827 RepID=U5C2T6_9BACT|nr:MULTISPECIES: DUF547 domain-containing protein [Rhodonellum]ERM84343.1 hypothetical protein P872_14960 [Rhodonellum psychrophilum GCM71 = DSM 17998]SDZ42920.1 Protein of unknown function, DUF547 [Rhodonellum ikkaensis]